MQLWETLSFPSANHFACGGSHSNTLVGGCNQSSSSDCSPQKASGSRSASAYILRYSSSDRTFAHWTNPSGGATGFSSSTGGSNSSIEPPGCSAHTLLDLGALVKNPDSGRRPGEFEPPGTVYRSVSIIWEPLYPYSGICNEKQ